MMGDNKTDDDLKWILAFAGARYEGNKRTPTRACICIEIPVGDKWTLVKILKDDMFERDDIVLGRKIGNWYVSYAIKKYPFFANNHEDAIRKGCGIVRNILTELLSKLSNAESFPLHWENGGLPVNLETLDKDTNGALTN